MRTVPVVCVAFSLMLPCFAGKAREWKNGIVTESTSNRRTEVTGATTTTNPNGTSDTSLDRRTSDVHTYLIDAGDRFYVIEESIRRMGNGIASFALGKGAGLVPGSAIRYSVERDSIYVLGDDGKERKFHISRVSLKPNSAK